jgi:hypothetical protein
MSKERQGNIANTMLAEVPVRIQRSRQSKQVSPNGLPIAYVGRPGKWGNPFKIVGDIIYGDAGHRRKILSKWIYIEPDANDFINWSAPLNEIVISLYINWLAGNDKNFIIPVPFENVNELKGKNLSCWCPKNCKCHADILLELANR